MVGVEISYFAEGAAPTWHTEKFAGYVLTDVATFDELLGFWAECRTNQPDLRALLVVNEPGQAFYTAGHALTELEGIDTEPLDARAYAAHLMHQLERQQVGKDLDWLVGRLMAVDAAEVALVEVNRDPSQLIGKTSYCFLVPVSEQRSAFVGAVQSYFGPPPHEVLAIIDYFCDRFDYELVGLDSHYIYFTRSVPVDGSTATMVVEAIGRLHRNFDDAARVAFRSAIEGQALLILTFRDW